MSDDVTDDDTPQGEYVSIKAEDLIGLRAKAKHGERADTATAELEAAKRELAFVRAGVNLDSPMGRLFVKGYDGESTLDATTAAWGEVAGIDTPDPVITDVDRAVATGRQDLSTGALVDAGDRPLVPGHEAALQAGRETLAKGRSRDDALGAFVGSVIASAAQGDKSVIIEYAE